MNRGKLPGTAVLNEAVEDLEDVFDLEHEDPEELRTAFWNYLYELPKVTAKQRHVLVRRLVDEAQFGDIAKELNCKAPTAHEIFKAGIKNLRSYREQT